MTKRELGTAIIRILASLALFRFLLMLFGLASLSLYLGRGSSETMPQSASLLSFVGPMVVSLIVGVILWSCAESLSGMLLPGEETTTAPVLGKPEVLWVAITSIGLYILFQGLLRLPGTVTNLVMSAQEQQASLGQILSMSQRITSNLVGTITHFVVGAGLLYCAQPLANRLTNRTAEQTEE